MDLPGERGAQIACEVTRQAAASPPGISCPRASAIVEASKRMPPRITRPAVDWSTAPPAPSRRWPAGHCARAVASESTPVTKRLTLTR